jgi:hypothetical protein
VDKDDCGEHAQVGDGGTIAARVSDCSSQDGEHWHGAQALNARPVQSSIGPHCASGPAR